MIALFDWFRQILLIVQVYKFNSFREKSIDNFTYAAKYSPWNSLYIVIVVLDLVSGKKKTFQIMKLMNTFFAKKSSKM